MGHKTCGKLHQGYGDGGFLRNGLTVDEIVNKDSLAIGALGDNADYFTLEVWQTCINH